MAKVDKYVGSKLKLTRDDNLGYKIEFINGSQDNSLLINLNNRVERGELKDEQELMRDIIDIFTERLKDKK